MIRTYAIVTERFGVLLREDDNIKLARLWAWKAFHVPPHSVRRVHSGKLCERCESQPCCCPSLGRREGVGG